LTGLPALQYSLYIPEVLVNVVNEQLAHESYVSESGFNDTYDYVIIGGGSGGSVMASRLSENSSVSVLLIEAGSAETFVSDVPMACIVLQKTPMDWAFETTAQNNSCWGLDGQQMPIPRGKAMGGSSTINNMIYMRGNPLDYDNWAANGATNWSWPDVFPYFIKAEDNKNQSYLDSGYHGKGGPLTVTSAYAPRLSDFAFQDAGQYFGYPAGDVNGESQSHFTITQRTIRNGERCSVSKAYLETLAANRKNLKVLVNSYVTKILFNGTTATGVQFEINSQKFTVQALKEVILSAGTINSPKILMLSGLKKNGIEYLI
jgi:glucose dehydrogenase (acceptor)